MMVDHRVDIRTDLVDFSVNDTAACVPLCVIFTDLSTIAAGGTNAQWWWNFGDGSTSTEQNPTHEYAVPGRYTVSLTATNTAGSDTETKTHYIQVNTAPVRVPCIAWDNLLLADDVTISVSSEEEGFEKENAADWKLFTWWKATASGDSYYDITFDSARAATCLALAGHTLAANAGWCQLRYSLDDGATWLNATGAYMPADSKVIYLRFDLLMSAKYRLFISSPGGASAIACIFIGEDMVMPVGDRIGMGPPELTRATELTNTVSQGGVLLGRSVVYSGAELMFSFDYLEEEWIYANWLPFVKHAEQDAFLVQWHPATHSDQAAYCWVDDGKMVGNKFTYVAHMSATLKAMARTE